MNSIFPVSELAVISLFAVGLIWLVVELVRQDPQALIAARRRPTAFRHRTDDAHDRFQSSSIC